jgi:hypothetical protein
METEALAGDVPAPDVVTPAESSPAPETAETVTAETGKPDPDVISPVQKRFDKLTWEKGELARRAEMAERRARELEERLYTRQEPEKVESKGPPTLAQFEYDEAKYAAAVLEYTRAEASKAAQEVLRTEREKEKAEGRAKSFRERETEFSAKTPDYREKVYSSEFMAVPILPEVAALIAESTDGPGIAYYLAENIPLAAEIARLPPMLAAREIGKIEAKLEQAKATPAPVVSKAPAPPPKVDAVEPDVKKGIDDPTISDAEFAAIRKRQIAQRRNM